MLLGVLAACSVLASEMPRAAAWMLACAALLHAFLTAADGRRAVPHALAWDGDAGVLAIDGVAVDDPRLQWRGPLVFLSWRTREGRRRRLAWWPDTLDAGQRRELRLAAAQGNTSRAAGQVAP